MVGSRSEDGKVYIQMEQMEIAGMRKTYDLFEYIKGIDKVL
jgi:hypothetical protein